MATPAAVMAQGKSRTASGGDTTLRSLSLPPGHLPFPLTKASVGPKLRPGLCLQRRSREAGEIQDPGRQSSSFRLAAGMPAG